VPHHALVSLTSILQPVLGKRCATSSTTYTNNSLLRAEQLKQRQLAKSPSGAFPRLRRGLDVAAFVVSTIYDLLDLRGGALVLDVELLAALDGPALDAFAADPGVKGPARSTRVGVHALDQV
jgi:hypothetical protein